MTLPGAVQGDYRQGLTFRSPSARNAVTEVGELNSISLARVLVCFQT